MAVFLFDCRYVCLFRLPFCLFFFFSGRSCVCPFVYDIAVLLPCLDATVFSLLCLRLSACVVCMFVNLTGFRLFVWLAVALFLTQSGIQPVSLFVFVSVCPPVCPSVCLFVYCFWLTFRMYVSVYVCMFGSFCLSVCLCAFWSVDLSARSSFGLSIRLSVFVCFVLQIACLAVWLSLFVCDPLALFGPVSAFVAVPACLCVCVCLCLRFCVCFCGRVCVRVCV